MAARLSYVCSKSVDFCWKIYRLWTSFRKLTISENFYMSINMSTLSFSLSLPTPLLEGLLEPRVTKASKYHWELRGLVWISFKMFKYENNLLYIGLKCSCVSNERSSFCSQLVWPSLSLILSLQNLCKRSSPNSSMSVNELTNWCSRTEIYVVHCFFWFSLTNWLNSI